MAPAERRYEHRQLQVIKKCETFAMSLHQYGSFPLDLGIEASTSLESDVCAAVSENRYEENSLIEWTKQNFGGPSFLPHQQVACCPAYCVPIAVSGSAGGSVSAAGATSSCPE
jgi:hypothetical protein